MLRRRGRKRSYERQRRPVEMKSRACFQELRMIVCIDPFATATHLRHVVALALHRSTTDALFPSQRTIRHAGQHRRCGGYEQEQRDEASDATHATQYMSYRGFADFLTYLIVDCLAMISELILLYVAAGMMCLVLRSVLAW